jgi:hypothetical protein
MFAKEADTYTKVVASFTLPVRAPFKEGDKMTALQARALSTYHLDRGASVANSSITRGAWSKLSDAEKVAKATAYLSGNGEDAYSFSDEIGGDVFGITLLNESATNILARIPSTAAKVAGMSERDMRKSLENSVAKFLNDPAATAKYADAIRAEIAAILAVRVERTERTTKPEGGEVEVEY